MSQEQYAVGKNVQQYLNDFDLQYKSPKESASLLPQPIQSIMQIVNETITCFESQYNLGKETSKEILVFCRPAVERYIFGKLFDKLFVMYAIKNETEDINFLNYSSQIKKINPSETMKFLGIKDKFIFNT